MRIHFSSLDRPKAVAKKLKASLSFLGTPMRLSQAQEQAALLYGYISWHELRTSIGTLPRSPDDEELTASLVVARREYQVAKLVDAGIPLNQATYAIKMIAPTSGNCVPFCSFDDAQAFFEELRELVGATGFRFYTREADIGKLAFRISGRWISDPIRRLQSAEQLNELYPWCAGLSAVLSE